MKIERIRLRNFRNFVDTELTFNDFTEIIRNNGWGKSNIADAIAWIFTNHLYDGTSDIESIKPKFSKKSVVEVELVLDNGLQLGKTYKELWVKTRGSSDLELKGHATTYYVNGLEFSQTAYDEKITSTLNIDKDTFHLLIDPTYFGLKLEWKQRRSIINDIVGEITFDQITKANSVFMANPTLTARLESSLKGFDNKVDLTKKSFIQNLNRLKKEQKDLESQIVGLNLITTTIDETTFRNYKTQDERDQAEIISLKENQGTENKIKILEDQMERLRQQFKQIESQRFTMIKPTQDNCPNCNFVLNSKDYETKLNHYQSELSKWNDMILRQKRDIVLGGNLLKDQVEMLKSVANGTTNGYSDRIIKLQEQIGARETEKSSYLAWRRAQDTIVQVSIKLDSVNKEINTYEQLSDLLGFYVSTMLEKLDERLKETFGDIKFRLIESNIKEGSWNEVCEVLDGEVPYDRTNTASQIKIGVKLIQAIRIKKNYPQIPIIIDNAEAVVNRKFETDSQIICLIAGKDTH